MSLFNAIAKEDIRELNIKKGDTVSIDDKEQLIVLLNSGKVELKSKDKQEKRVIR